MTTFFGIEYSCLSANPYVCVSRPYRNTLKLRQVPEAAPVTSATPGKSIRATSSRQFVEEVWFRSISFPYLGTEAFQDAA